MIGDDGDDGLLAFSGNDFIVGGRGNDRINANSPSLSASLGLKTPGMMIYQSPEDLLVNSPLYEN